MDSLNPASNTDPQNTPARRAPRIWSIAGGKGGVGRSLLTANLGIHLARAGHRVILIDLDLQGGNLHNYLGYSRLSRGLTDFAAATSGRLSDLLLDSSSKKLRLIGGVSRRDLRDEPISFVRRVAAQIHDLPADIVIIDCGSGRSPEAVASFATANVGILVSSPEPAAIESACLFAEAHLRACLAHALQPDDRATLDEYLKEDGGDPRAMPFRTIMSRLGSIDRSSRQAVGRLVRLTRLELLLNQTRGAEDEDAATSMVSGFRKCFGINLRVAGAINHDPAVLTSVYKRRLLAKQFPNTAATREIARAADRLVSVSDQGLDDSDTEWEDLAQIDHYRALEIPPRASSKQIQAAYQKLRRAYDPETTLLAPLLEVPALRATLGRIEDAYRTLIFLESRVEYDRQLDAADRSGEGDSGETAAPPRPAASAPSPRPAAPATPRPVGRTADPNRPEGPVPGSGRLLREERQRQHQTLEAIGARTKIPIAHLRALEEERFADLPAAVYMRGFLKEYAHCLGYAGDAVVQLYMERYRTWRDAVPGTGSSGGSRGAAG